MRALDKGSGEGEGEERKRAPGGENFDGPMRVEDETELLGGGGGFSPDQMIIGSSSKPIFYGDGKRMDNKMRKKKPQEGGLSETNEGKRASGTKEGARSSEARRRKLSPACMYQT